MLNPLYIWTVATNKPLAATDIIHMLINVKNPYVESTTPFCSLETSLVSFDLREGAINEDVIAKTDERFAMSSVLEKLRTVKQTAILEAPMNIRM